MNKRDDGVVGANGNEAMEKFWNESRCGAC